MKRNGYDNTFAAKGETVVVTTDGVPGERPAIVERTTQLHGPHTMVLVWFTDTKTTGAVRLDHMERSNA